MGGEASGAKLRPLPTVNNFAAATGAATGSGWPLDCHFLYPVKCFPAPAGQVCERQVALTTLSLLTGPSGGA